MHGGVFKNFAVFAFPPQSRPQLAPQFAPKTTLPTVEFAPISKKITPTLDKRSHLCYNKLMATA